MLDHLSDARFAARLKEVKDWTGRELYARKSQSKRLLKKLRAAKREIASLRAQYEAALVDCARSDAARLLAQQVQAEAQQRVVTTERAFQDLLLECAEPAVLDAPPCPWCKHVHRVQGENSLCGHEGDINGAHMVCLCQYGRK